MLPQPPGPVAGLLAFTGHHVVAADVDPEWVASKMARAVSSQSMYDAIVVPYVAKPWWPSYQPPHGRTGSWLTTKDGWSIPKIDAHSRRAIAS